MGLTDFVSVEAYCRASLIRTANSTIKGWKRMYDTIKLTAEQHLSVDEHARGRLSTSWWDPPPYVHFLQHAYYGTGGYADTQTASCKARGATRALVPKVKPPRLRTKRVYKILISLP